MGKNDRFKLISKHVVTRSKKECYEKYKSGTRDKSDNSDKSTNTIEIRFPKTKVATIELSTTYKMPLTQEENILEDVDSVDEEDGGGSTALTTANYAKPPIIPHKRGN